MSEAKEQSMRIGEYQVLAKISSGGMGDVLLVRRSGVHGFEKMAAIKIVRSNQPNFAQLRTMFLDEARLMARINHPAIAQVYDFGEEGDRLYLVMEYVSGISFDDLILHRPSPVIAARAMADVLLGLHAAHRLTDLSGAPLGVVHRDVSPQNLMLNFDGCVKILDFGIALMKDRQTQATQCGQIKGKPAYMAPEQIRNQPIDHRTDIFAASIVLYEMLTGHRLFVGDNLYAVAKAVEESIIVPPSSVVGLLPDGLDDVVMQGLARDPENRFQSALAMAQALAIVVSRTGGDTLEQYATHAMAQDRIAHLEWLQKVISGTMEKTAGEIPSGRPDGIETKPLKFTSLTSEIPLDEAETRILGQPDYITSEDLIAPQRKKRFFRRLALVMLLAVVSGVGGWIAWDRLARPVDTKTESVESPLPETADAVPAEPEREPPGDKKAPDTSGEAKAEDPVVEDVKLGLDLGSDKPKPRRKRPVKRRRRIRRPAKMVKPVIPPEPAGTEMPGKKVTEVAPIAFGFVTVAAHPYARVRIDGKDVGITPILDRRLPIGPHTITLISPDTGEVRLEKKVNLTENRHEKVIAR